MINLYEGFEICAPRLVRGFKTFADAKAHALKLYDVALFEDDLDHADCADFITQSGTLYMIEPASRRA